MPAKEKFTKNQVIEAMWLTGAIVMDMAKTLNTSSKVIYDYLARYPELEVEKKLVEAATLDMAQSKLLQAIKRGDMRAVRFYLMTKGKHLGYTTKIEVDNKPNDPKPITKKAIDYKSLPTEVIRALIEHTIEDEEENEEEAA